MPARMILAILVALLISIPAFAQDVNAQLIEAAQNGQAEKVQALLEGGADADAKDENGMTALMWAALGGHTDTVKGLLDAGADASLEDKQGTTARLWATGTEIRQLLELGANDGILYTNTSLGFSFRFPADWVAHEVDDPILLKTTPANSGNPMLEVFSVELPDNPFMNQTMRDEKSWLAVQEVQMKERFEVRRPARAVSYGNTEFHRLDTQSRSKNNRTYQAQVVTFVGRTVLSFNAAGMSAKEVEDVLKSLQTLTFVAGRP